MTVHEIIKRLVKRKLVTSKVIGKKKYYFKNSNLSESKISLGEISNIRVHKGMKTYFPIWAQFHGQKNLRNIFYMSNKSVAMLIKKLGVETWISENYKIDANNHISDIFIEPKFIETVQKIVTKEQFKKWIKSLKRKYVACEVPRDVFYSENDILIFRDSLFITNNETEVSIEIKQTETIDIMKQFFELLKHTSNRVDFNSKIESFAKN
jgi:hypothetical protein